MKRSNAQQHVGLHRPDFRQSAAGIEIQRVGWGGGSEKVEFVAHAQDEVVGTLRGLDLGGLEVALGGKVLKGVDPSFTRAIQTVF